jgi:serine/threonine protein kinase
MSTSELIGHTLGQYRIETLIDAGGMGQVFRGVHIYLDRPAAIKVMRPHLANSPRFRERFLQEARSAAALKHENIVDIYEFGEQDNILYLVMEFVPDGSLRSLLHKRSNRQSRPLSLDLDLVRQAALGLAAAQKQGFVHRDIKPDNLLLQRTSAQGVNPEQYLLKISDFGLARLVESSNQTSTGSPLGTLAYMSPEQCIGAKVDGRSDLYSLGVVLYEIATGYLPFQIENFDDALRKHTQAIPPPPRQIRPDLPASLETIILRCLAKKPEDRYQNGADLARDLQSVQTNAAIETLGASLPGIGGADYTVAQATGAGNTAAPLVATLQGYSSLPRVRVLDKSGETVQVAEVTGQGFTIGRQPGNGIVLASNEISRQHLRIEWDGRQVTVKDLGSGNGTKLEHVRLQPNVSQVWQERKVIHIGPYFLRLEGANSDATAINPAATNLPPTALVDIPYTQQQRLANATYDPSGGASARIGVKVEPTSIKITPERPAQARVMLTNLGILVDWLTVTVEGVPSEWVQGPAGEVQLNPGMQETVDLGINVPRSPESLAKDYPVVIRARSREKPSESGTAQARWTVLPFREDTLRIEPRKVRARGKARYAVTVTNNGNIPVRHELSGDDDEQKMHYEFNPERLALEPGNATRVILTVEGERRFIGKDQSQRFQVHSRASGTGSPSPVTSTSNSPLAGNAEFVNSALIPPWVLSVVGGALALALVLGSLFALRGNPAMQAMLPAFMAPAVNTTNTTGTGTGANANTGATTQTTPPPNAVSPMKLAPTQPATQQVLPTMQAMTAPTTVIGTTNAFVQQATAANSNNNFTVISNKFTNNIPNAAVFITPNATPPGTTTLVLDSHPTGVWFENANWAIFHEDTMPLAQQTAFNVWIPKNANLNIVQQASAANTAGIGTTINNPLVNGNPNVILLVTQVWNPGGTGGVFNPHPVGVAFNNGSWAIFNEDGAAMTPGASFNIHVLQASKTNFVQTASPQNMSNGGVVISNATITSDPKAIIMVTQLWNPGGAAGVYNNHPIGLAFNGTNWTVVNEDQTPIPQGASFNISIIQP